MEITKERNGSSLTVALKGRLDTTTAPEAQKFFEGCYDGTTDLVIDFTELAYISSMGLRLILMAQKQMMKQGSMKVVGVNSNIMEVLDDVGFCDIMTIEPAA